MNSSEEKVLQRVLSDYPSPIASPARWLLAGVHRGDAMRQFLNGILDTYEATIHFLALVQLKEYLQARIPDAACNLTLRQILERDISLGHWAWIVRELTRRLIAHEKPMILQGLNNLMGKTGWERAAKPLDDLVTERNQTRGHPTKFLEKKDFHRLVEKNEPLLVSLLAELSFLANLNLTGVVSWEAPGSMRIHEAMVFRGKDADTYFRLRYGKQVLVPVEPGEREGLLLLEDERQGKWLKLGPLALFYQEFRRQEADLQDAYFLSSLDVKKRRIRAAQFRSYSPFSPSMVMSHTGDGSEWVRLTTAWLNKEFALDPGQQFETEKTFVDPRVDQILANKQIGFVGRTEQLAKVEQSLATPPRFVHVKGPKGQGKTAFIARFIQRAKDRQQPVLYYFFSQTEGTVAVESALFHILAQANELNLCEEPPRPDRSVEELLRDLFELLTDSSKRTAGKPLWLVMDGLDEAENVASALQPLWLSLEQQPLPDGTAVLLAARVDSPCGVALPFELEGLATDEVQQMLFRKGISASEQFSKKLCEILAGNPLLVMQAIESLPENPTVDDIPKSSVDWQKDEFEKLLQLSTVHGCEAAFRSIAALLTAAAELLPHGVLRELAQAPDGQIGHAFRIISPIVSGRNRLGFFHHSITEGVAKVLQPDEVAMAHSALADWCLRSPHETYARHLIQHLLKADRFDQARAQLTEQIMGQRIESGANLEDVLADVRRFIALGRRDVEQLPGLCSVMVEISRLVTKYRSQKSPADMVGQKAVAELVAYAELLEGLARRRLLLAALLMTDPDSLAAKSVQEELEADLDGLESAKDRAKYRSLIKKVAQKPLPNEKPRYLNALPHEAYAAVITGDDNRAVKALRTFVREGDITKIELVRRCLHTLALLCKAPPDLLETFRLAGQQDAQSLFFLRLIEGDRVSAKSILASMGEPQKPSDIHHRIVMAKLLEDEQLICDLLHKLQTGAKQEYLKALCHVVNQDHPAPEHLAAFAAHVGDAEERQLLTLCSELCACDKRNIAALIAAAGANTNAEPTLAHEKFTQWCEEVVECLAEIDPDRAERLIATMVSLPRQAMAWAILAANLRELDSSRRERYVQQARDLCEQYGDTGRTSLRVREMIAVASGGAAEDLDAFWGIARRSSDLNEAFVLARSLGFHLACKGKVRAAELFAEQIKEFLQSSGRSHNEWFSYRYRNVLSWVGFWGAVFGADHIAKDYLAMEYNTNPESEFLARMQGRLAYAKFLRGDREEAAVGFARAIHLARQIGASNQKNKSFHGIASALFWIAVDELKAGLCIEAQAHVKEAWQIMHASEPNSFCLIEILGAMAYAGLADEAQSLLKSMLSQKRQDQAKGYMARGLVIRVREIESLSEPQREHDLWEAHRLINSIHSPTARYKQIREILRELIPRAWQYQSPDPLPQARRPLLNFILANVVKETQKSIPGFLSSNLIQRSIVHNAIRVVIRMLREPAHAQVLEDIFHVAGSGWTARKAPPDAG